MKELDRLLTKFYESVGEEKTEFCLKVLKLLVKNHSLLIWSLVPSDRTDDFFKFSRSFEIKDFAMDYYARSRSKSGKEFCLSLGLGFDEAKNITTYEFEVYGGYTWRISYKIFKTIIPEPPKIIAVFSEKNLPLKYGYLIQELYNQVANQMQYIVELKRIKEELVKDLKNILT